MKILKPLAIAVAAIVLIAAAALAYIVTTFDSARIKQEAAQAMMAKTGRTLSIDGNLKLKFWPSISMDIEKVTLSEPKSRQIPRLQRRGWIPAQRQRSSSARGRG